ncbi:YbdK family carboxylate-amine ligase [Leucobacter allii]|uniref:Putative glutamate--cysteine ligase 2 n=1 Tax=Leucobacter allii TaxID=2932247 RepID=A0ABY4FQG9_9MICO|nr:YbdK family carboxylate-amine ligase [Leucobacter allii]UOQ58434.1 YbdK family carboxylate-amine ligase [Leucobacter allii]UOR03014.1 YbdK family carboxylate-amine ligase [Leucobacter allii]
MDRAFGIEEEFLLLDARSGLPVDRAAEVIRAVPELGRLAEREFLASQLEVATPVCRTAAAAEEFLAGFRTAAADAAERCGAVLASTGLAPFGGAASGAVTPKPRYLRIRAEMREVAAHQFMVGTHVHVEVPSREAGVDALARLARWMPVLLAMTANSPLWCGAATGFASWRHIRGLAWPTAGYPPAFPDGAAYSDGVAELIDAGVLIDAGHLTWTARLSERYPTIELRIADAQLDHRDSVAFAVIVRALVERALRALAAGAARPRCAPALVDGASWLAARDGLGAMLVDPSTGIAAPARVRLVELFDEISEELERFGDRERATAYLARLRRTGSPAERQLGAFRSGGAQALLRLYASAARIPFAAPLGVAPPLAPPRGAEATGLARRLDPA